MRYYDVHYNWCVVFHFTHDYDMWDGLSVQTGEMIAADFRAKEMDDREAIRCKNNTLVFHSFRIAIE